MGEGNKYPSKHIWYIILLAFILRLLFIIAMYSFPTNLDYHTNDSKEYLNLAQELALHGRFFTTLVPASLSRPFTPEIVRTPGYPLFLLPGVWSGYVKLITIVLQIILGCLTVYFTYQLTLVIFNREYFAIIAAIIFALDPMSIFFTPYLLTETLFTFLLILVTYFFIKSWGQGLLRNSAIAGAILAAATFVRPAAYFLPVYLMLVIMGYFLLKGTFNKKFLIQAGVFLCCSMIPMGLWQVRNFLSAGYPGFSTISAVNLYFYNSAAVRAKLQNVSYTDLQVDMGLWNVEDYLSIHPEQQSWTEAARFHYMQEEGSRIIRNNLYEYIKIHLSSMLRVIIDPGAVKFIKLFKFESDQFQFLKYYVDYGIIKTIKIIYSDNKSMFILYFILGSFLSFIILFACMSFFSKIMTANLQTVILLAIVIYFIVISGCPADPPRFRLPIMPLIAIFAGVGIGSRRME